jgi:hypothetical protein
MVRFLFALNPQAAIDLFPVRATERPLWLAELEIVADSLERSICEIARTPNIRVRCEALSFLPIDRGWFKTAQISPSF